MTTFNIFIVFQQNIIAEVISFWGKRQLKLMIKVMAIQIENYAKMFGLALDLGLKLGCEIPYIYNRLCLQVLPNKNMS